MRNWIQIDGKYSFEHGLRMARLPIWTAAAETVENITVPGVPVEYDRHTGQYEDFELTLTGYTTYLPFDFGRLNAWLQNGKQLIMSTQPHMYGIIRRVGQIAPERVGTRGNEVRIPLTFQPFKYNVHNRADEYDESPAYINCLGNFYAEPVYRLTVDSERSGAAFFKVNDTQVTILNPAIQTGTVVIDVPRKKIYMEQSGVLTIVQQYTTGNFWDLILNPGKNTITWNDHVISVSIQKNERWL